MLCVCVCVCVCLKINMKIVPNEQTNFEQLLEYKWFLYIYLETVNGLGNHESQASSFSLMEFNNFLFKMVA